MIDLEATPKLPGAAFGVCQGDRCSCQQCIDWHHLYHIRPRAVTPPQRRALRQIANIYKRAIRLNLFLGHTPSNSVHTTFTLLERDFHRHAGMSYRAVTTYLFRSIQKRIKAQTKPFISTPVHKQRSNAWQYGNL